MNATHDQFSRQMSSRLMTTSMGLGLVRLLQDARRFEEAKATLYALEFNYQEAAEKADGVSLQSKEVSCSSESALTLTEVAEMQTMPSSLA